MNMGKRNHTIFAAVIGGIVVALLLIVGTMWMGKSASVGTEEAVRSVSLLYLDELAERREQVVANNLEENISKIDTAIGLLTEEDLSDAEHLQQFQKRMKALLNLEKFAFVDTDGLIYTALGTQNDIDEYAFDYRTITGPEISVKNRDTKDKKVIIAVPVDGLVLGEKPLAVVFMEISMDNMLSGASIKTNNTDVTFCNIYAGDGLSLTNTVIDGQSEKNNILEVLEEAEFENGYTLEQMTDDFREGRKGVVSFTYHDIRETLSYMPVERTDWMLTYLIRESVISEKIKPVSDRIIYHSLIQSLFAALLMAAIFGFIILQDRRNAALILEKETSEAEMRGKQEELLQKIALQEQLVEKSQALSDALVAAEEANKAKTAFLSNMSHEIRTPMNAIIGLDNIALNDPETPPKTREYLEKIGDSAHHLLDLINDILDMSRIESGRMVLRNEEFSFSKLMENINTMFSSSCEEKGLTYSCHIIGHIDDCYIGDNMKLRQVLINILGNAVKFTPCGGRVGMEVERVAAYERRSTIRFKIADTGIGMSKEYLPHIFDTFSQEDSSSTSKYGSSGLGMAITKNIVEMMNGNIEVESEKGKGTTFTVTVTLMDCEKQTYDDECQIRPGEMSVLIVDDDQVACEHARLVLEKAGISSETAASGAEALEKVQLRHARRTPYNLILVDWKMPEMDGVETSRRIRDITGDASAIIILTAYRWDDVLEEAMAAGVDSFISKPLFANNVLEEFTRAYKRKHISAGAQAVRADLTGRRILLAEDVAINAEIMTMILNVREMEVDHAENGRIAVEKFSEHPEEYYDAILMDLRMPEMDGLEATRKIRAMDRKDAGSIPIIALTANAFDEDVQRSLQAGLNAHLSKPVEPDDLYETLECLIKA
ncbi:MAG: response regulator [Lachnospiraceae bacterium]|nr:response regulator [Lachnospiraceae bacterium]